MNNMKEKLKLTIDRLGHKDLDRAAANCDLFWQMPPSTKKLSQFLHDESCMLLVAEFNSKPIGQALGYILKRWDMKQPKIFLYSIDVVEMYRKRGVGRRLIETFYKIGKDYGCGTMFVPTSEKNIPAVRLYETTGGKRITDSDAVMFEWGLE